MIGDSCLGIVTGYSKICKFLVSRTLVSALGMIVWTARRRRLVVHSILVLMGVDRRSRYLERAQGRVVRSYVDRACHSIERSRQSGFVPDAHQVTAGRHVRYHDFTVAARNAVIGSVESNDDGTHL